MKLKNKIIYIIILFYYFKLKRELFIRYKNIKVERNNIDFINHIKKLKKVVYTIILGKYDKTHSVIKEKGYDYFLLTNQNLTNNTNSNWTIIRVEENKLFINRIEQIKAQRFYKTHPHIFFKNYDLSIYVDATFSIKGGLNEFLLRILTPHLSIYLLEHPHRNKIYNELTKVVTVGRDSQKNILPIKRRYSNENFPDNNGLVETCLIVRKHNDIDCKKFMQKWYNEIKHYSHRDQLSFNYIYWKSKNKIVKYISKRYIWKYFNQHGKHLLHFRFKNS